MNKATATESVLLRTDEKIYNGQHRCDFIDAPDPEKGTRVVHAIVTTRTPCGRLHRDGHIDAREHMAALEYERLFHDSGVGTISGINPDGLPKDTVFRESVESDSQIRARQERRDAEKAVGQKDSHFLYHVAGYGTEVEMVAWRYGKRPDEVRESVRRGLSTLADLWRY